MSAKNNAPRFILDSYALIAYLENESGGERVTAILEQAAKNQVEVWLAIINFGEVIYITEREQGLIAAQQAIASLDQLPIKVVDVDRKLTFTAAHIKAKHALSYADAFVVALAQDKEGTILTGDPEFKWIADDVSIEWLPSK